MRISRNIVATSLALPMLALSACTSEVTETGFASQSGAEGPGTTEGETAAPTSGDMGPANGPREPLANSINAIFVDLDGKALPGAWVQQLDPVIADPDVPPGVTPSMADDRPPPLRADSAGVVLVEALPAGQQRWQIGAPGFVTRTEVFTIADGTRTKHIFRMTPVGETFTIDTNTPSDLAHKNVKIHLPPGYMVKKRTGERVTGPVRATVTVVSPGPDNRNAAPVPLVGEDFDGGSGDLISFGMIGVELKSMEGDLLELNDDVAATVAVELSDELTAQIDALGVKIIPAWHADPDKGDTIWKEVGVFFLSEKNENGRYVATTYSVKKFSWINTDLKSDDPRCYVIKVVDAQNQPIVGHDVQLEYNGWPKTGFTGADGTLCFDMAVNTSAKITVPDEPFVTINAKMGDPKSVCTENNRPWYVGFPKGACTEVLITVNDNNVCVPGSTWDCSDEKPFPDLDNDGTPDDLDGVGICKAAYRTCAEGTAWSDCQDPVLPQAEVCTKNEPQFDENCKDGVNEPGDPSCTCTPGQTQPCYTGNPADLDVSQTACQVGFQKCDLQSQWDQCNFPEPLLPNLSKENCDPGDKIESCSANPCDFDSLWWRSLGNTGSQSVLATTLGPPKLTAVTYVKDGATEGLGKCFTGPLLKKLNFSGVTLARYLTDNEAVPPDCTDANLITGKIDSGTIRGSANAKGAAVAGHVTNEALNKIAQDPFAPLVGCGAEIPKNTYFVTRFDDQNHCLFRSAATGGAVITDVAVGVSASRTYVAVTVPAGQGGALANCTFPVDPQSRAYYLMLEVKNDVVQCKSSNGYAGETPNVIDIDASGALAVAATQNSQVRVRLLNGGDPSMLVWEPMDPVVTFAGGSFTPLGISSRDQRIAVIGFGTGAFSRFNGPPVDVGADTDLVLLLSDPQHPERGTSVLGSGAPNNDLGDFGYAVEWVDYFDPITYIKSDALLIAGTSQSKDFSFGECWQDVNPEDVGAQIYDSFVGVLKHTPGQSFSVDSCAEHHPITGTGSQVVQEISVADMRVGVCGYHSGPIEIGGNIEAAFLGDNRSAHCGVAVLPVKP